MGRKDLYQQVMVIFGGLMVFFYLWLGLFIIFSPLFDHIDKVIRIIFGSAILIYCLTRAFRAYEKVKEVFFSGNDEEE